MKTRVQQSTAAGKFTNRRSPHALLRSYPLTCLVSLITVLAFGASPALAGEAHPVIEHTGFETDTFTNPNGIAIDQSTGDVYVAQLGADERQTVSIEGGPEGGSFRLEFEGENVSLPITTGSNPGEAFAPGGGEVEAALMTLTKIGIGNVAVSQEGSLPGTVTYTITFQGALAGTNVPQLLCAGSTLKGGTSPACTVATATQGVEGTVEKLDASGNPVEFPSLHSNVLTGAATPAGSFIFPPDARGTPGAIAVDNSTNPSDPSAGDLYVMDAGHGVIDKYNSEGKYLSQISGYPPATGSTERELLGVAVDKGGVVRAELGVGILERTVRVDEFDDSPENHLVATLENTGVSGSGSGVSEKQQEADGFAVGPTGDDFLLYGGACSCTAKLGQQLAGIGPLDNEGSGDVAVAADPATGHVYVESESSADSVTEWDTGAINGSEELLQPTRRPGVGVPVSSFGSSQLSGSAGQGGIAVNGKTGLIYVANGTTVDVFGSDAPAVTVAAATGVSKQGATLSGTVNPRGAALTSPCEFEYGVANEYGLASYEHTVPCNQTPSGTSPVAVSASIGALTAGLLYRYRLKTENESGAGESSGLFGTLGVGFGVKKFESSFLNEDGSPDTQAGSHPYEYLNTIEFNSRYIPKESNADSRWVQEPDGALKDLYVDLPPGVYGDPNATTKKCTLKELDELNNGGKGCPSESALGHLALKWGNTKSNGRTLFDEPVFNMVPPRGVALQLGINYINPDLFINNGAAAGGDYPIRSSIVNAPPAAPVLTSQLSILGVAPSGKPFWTLPTGCHGPLRSTIEVDSYEEPGKMVKEEYLSKNGAGTLVSLTGCSTLRFPPTINVEPDTTNASSSSGLTVSVDVPQTAAQNPHGLAESSLRDTTVALPAGVALNPSTGAGLEACSEGLAGFEIGHGVNGSGFEEFNPGSEPGVLTPTFNPDALEGLVPGVGFCPNGSKVGEVTVHTPLLPNALKGFVYLASQDANPFGSLFALYMMVEDPVSGSTIKLTGEVRLCEAAGEVIDGMACQGSGQIITTFKNTPDLPFENLELHFFGGERAPLATPSRCGTYTTRASFVPWDGNGAVPLESSFQIEHGPGGGPCPGASLPFDPSVTGGATNIQAGAFSPLTVTVNRKDGEQNLKSIVAKLPPGLSGVLSGVELCPEPRANEGLCGEGSKVGEATVSVGVGNQPFTVTGGRFFLTGPYNGTGACSTPGADGCAPFGLTFEVPAKAGPFDLENTANKHPACDCVVVRGKIELNPLTTAITITTDPPGSPYAIPTSIAGIPLEIQHINATTTRGNFQFNPTNCEKMALEGTVGLNEGGTSTITTPFQVTNCAALKFEPKFSVSTSAKTSRTSGASLTAKLTYPNVPQGTDADIARVKVELPKQLPSRLTTLQKACTATQFEANPAGCPAASKIGYAVVHTPLIPVPLQGPAIFVSHGGEAFPSLTLVLQGYGITIDLVGTTDIKNGVTSTTFKTVPDQPFSSFELTLPEGPYSALTTAGNLCTAKSLTMPTEFIAQNGAELKQSTKIAVTGCPKHKKTTHKKKHKRKAKTKHKRKM